MQRKAHSGVTAFLAALLLLPVCSRAQDAIPQEKKPQGWRILPMPIIGYNTDLGLELGATADLFDYGRNPGVFPDYRQRIRFAASYHFGGQSIVHAEYDSDYIIPGVRFSVSLLWRKNPLCNFYGFGGDVVTYDRGLDRRNDIAYYCHYQETVRFVSTFQGRINRHLNWMGGLSYWYCDNADTKYKQYDGTLSLYHFYRENGVILDNEVRGSVLEFRGGLRWDTRDFAPAPAKGICADLFFNGSPDIFGTGYSYLKLCAHFRHYITPGPDWLTFAYHLAYQGTIAGTAPFYMQQNICSLSMRQAYSEGLGGWSTLRGVMTGRLVGDGYAWGNVEIRIRIAKFQWLGTDFFVGINPFFDFGAIVQPYKIEEIAAATGESVDGLSRLSRKMHESAGMGLQFGIGKSSIMSLEAGKSFNDNDGPVGVSLAINYIF